MENGSDAIRKVCVFGVGGVGGYFGAKIADRMNRGDDPEFKTFFIARGEHLNAVKRNGIRLITPQKEIVGVPTSASDNILEIPTPDLILLCVKGYDLDNAVRAIQSKSDEHTLIVPLLNGADIYERIKAILKKGIVLPACVYVGTHIEQPGVIKQTGGDGTILIGKDPELPRFSPEKITSFFNWAGINFNWQEDPFKGIWGKYLFIAPFGLVTAYTGKTIGEILENEELQELVRKIMLEVKALAERKGIELSAHIVEESMDKARAFPFETKTSYQRDIESKGNLNEGDLFGGTIIRMGELLGISTPVTKSVYSAIEKRLSG